MPADRLATPAAGGEDHSHATTESSEIRRLLLALRSGEDGALDRLFPLVYDELHALARRQVRRVGRAQTLDTTALLHEAYLKLCDRSEPQWADRTHFIAVAATVMRHLLIDHARERTALKRGGMARKVTLAELNSSASAPTEDLLAVAQALDHLAAIDERLVRLVEMRFFGGLSSVEIGSVLGISERTVKREWRKAKALLFHVLEESPAS